MLSTIPDSYSKQADIHLTLSVRPYHVILQVTSPDLLSNDWSACRQMERRRAADVWNSCSVEISSFRKENYNQPTVSANHPTKWKNVAQYALGGIFSSITLLANWNRMLSLSHSLWWIRQLPGGYPWCFSTGCTSRWRRRLRRCRWPSAPATSPSNGAWLPAPSRTSPSRACSVSEQ